MAAYPGEISQAECQQMVSLLAGNHIGMLLQAGLPDGTRFAHKHGWVTQIDGLIHDMSDAGIVYSSGGNYVVTLYLHHPVQLLFERVNGLAAQLSTAVYNYFNLPE
jgi:beta-lactamase class A